jgi:glycosyltransferase involved in cell wall biosynthesis
MNKLAHVFNSIEYSGAEKMIFSLKDYYNLNFITYAISTGETKGCFYDEYEKHFNCYHLTISYERNVTYLKDFLKMIKFYRKEKINIIHIHPNRRFLFNVLAAKIGGVEKIIRQVHNNFEFTKAAEIKETIVRYLSKLLGVKIISISPSVSANELKRFKNKTIHVTNFYNEDFIFPATVTEKIDVRKNLGIPEAAFGLISIGTCCDRKQHKHIINVVSQLKSRIPNVFYIHLGNGEMEEEEKKLCEDLEIQNNVMFAGNVDNVRDYLVASDLYLITSKYEGLSIATIEAMGAAIPVISYSTPGSKDLCINGAPGILVKPNMDSLRERILELYSSSDTIKSIANKSHKYVMGTYSKKQAIINWNNIYFDK